MDHLTFAQLLGNYGEFIGAVAVVVTLVYLAAQIRQNTKQLASSSLQALADRAENRMLLIASNPGFAEVVAKFQSDPQSLTEIEETQLRGWLGAWVTDLEDSYRQFKMGSLSASTLDARVRFFRNLYQVPLIKKVWDENREFTEPEFAAWIEPKLSE